MKSLKVISAAVALMSVAACTTSGVGTASSPNGNLHATLTWMSKGDRSGAMTAQMQTGDTYTGPYYQISHETQFDELGPLWAGWGPGPVGFRGGWGGWGAWGPGPEFMTTYTGRVLANLNGPNGTHMRCRFELIHPRSGMSGGGIGSCQLPDGQTIDANFPQS